MCWPTHPTPFATCLPWPSPVLQTPEETRSPNWYHIRVPISDFKCEGAVAQDQLDRFDFQNTNERDAYICLDEIRLE